MGSGGAPGLSVCDPGPAQAPRSLVTSLPLCVFVHFASFRSKRSSEKFQGDLSQAEGEGILLSPGPAPQKTPTHSPCAVLRPAWSMLPAAMKGLSLVLLAALLCSAPAQGLWCQDCTLTTNSSHCTPKQCPPSDTVCASVRITDPSSRRKDHSVNKMCASSCDFVKRHFFSDYLMGFINSGILKVEVDCCEKDLCNGVSGVGGSPWALAWGLLLGLGPALLWAGP
ncbi:lymphocyte antigen 6H isoform X2 [Equus asinus]|nr:lymphocyte antigen 6H isoform X2 [Equus caballus]